MSVDEMHYVLYLFLGCTLFLYLPIGTSTYNSSFRNCLPKGIFSFLRLYASKAYACPSHFGTISFIPTTPSKQYVMKIIDIHSDPSFVV